MEIAKLWTRSFDTIFLAGWLVRRPGASARPNVAARDDSMTLAPDGSPRAADEEIEVDALVGLLHGLAIELDPAAIGMRRRRLPLRAAAPELIVRHVQLQAARVDIELDDVAVLYQGERTAGGGLRRRVQHDGSVRG